MYTIFNEKLTQLRKLFKQALRHRDPFFYFGVISFVLFGFLFFSSPSLAEPAYLDNHSVVFFNEFFKGAANTSNGDVFFSQNEDSSLETPDLKIADGSFVAAVSTPSILNTQTLGDISGGPDQSRTETTIYTVKSGDTVSSVASLYGVTPETVAWANDISKNTALTVGKELDILPVSGVMYTVRSGDTLEQIVRNHSDKNHQVNIDEVVAFNGLADREDIRTGDTFVIVNGAMIAAPVARVNIQTPQADSFFINPTQGIITQRLHKVNAVDIANQCGTPIYAAASGVVQRAVGNGTGYLGSNYITILHSNGVVTYYGHIQPLFVKAGDTVNVGDRIALMGGAKGELGAGLSTGCHLHFDVPNGKNPLAGYQLGDTISFK